MKYVRTELFKLRHSLQAIFGYGLALFLILVIIIGYKVRGDFTISGLDITLVSLGNLVNSMTVHFIMVLVTSFLFAGEFTNKTFKYIMIRPVSLGKLFWSKLIALWLYCGQVILFVGIVSLVIGFILWGAGPVHGEKSIVLEDGLLRPGIFYLGTWINIIFIITLAAFFAVILKNQVSTVITTMGVFILMAISTKVIPQMMEFSPIGFYNLKPYLVGTVVQWSKIGQGIVVTWGYSVVLFLLSYLILVKKDILL
ncbi:hypothetical protein BBF96_00395 [Anoxybacter fermentans]|uniref:ABC transporter permease n=1 Tax=Anoxybacter fermentans TaxID=1323375 RepID=A0A3Q9HND7_9FIRM|nr:ABC transporter permease [Anoxybacter fermentans]AZR71996.1 hypothetical protein BBF96_00395 [Anoxybacter fermentans]